MKRLSLVVLAVLMLAATTFAANVTFKYDYDFSVDPACSALKVTNCVARFEFWIGTQGSGTLLGSVPAPSGATTNQTNLTAAFNMANYGTTTVNYYAVAKDSSGVDVYSAPLAVSGTVKPGGPKNGSFQ